MTDNCSCCGAAEGIDFLWRFKLLCQTCYITVRGAAS